MHVNEDECRAAGVDPEKVKSIARRMEKAALEAQALGICVFGGMSGTLRFGNESECGTMGALVLAGMDGNWSGGTGAESDAADGLIRGE